MDNTKQSKESESTESAGSRSQGEPEGAIFPMFPLKNVDQRVRDMLDRHPLASMVGIIAAGYIADSWMKRQSARGHDSNSDSGEVASIGRFRATPKGQKQETGGKTATGSEAW